MSYRSEVAAIVGGSSEQIKNFADRLTSAEFQYSSDILSMFKIIKIDADLSVYALYDCNLKWYGEAETDWENICKMAIEAKLAYVFSRIGDDLSDVEYGSDCNCDDTNIGDRLLNMMGIQRDIYIDEQISSHFE